MRDEELDAMLTEAPTLARLPWDLWPALEQRVAGRPWWSSPGLATAAATAVFALGAVSGAALIYMVEGRQPSVAPRWHSSSAFLAAARVQSSGSAYVAAVGELHQLDLDGAEQDAVTIAQGYEAALAAVEAVTQTVDQAPATRIETGEMTHEVARVRNLMGRQVSEMLGERRSQ